jgi:hypothetical protein
MVCEQVFEELLEVQHVAGATSTTASAQDDFEKLWWMVWIRQEELTVPHDELATRNTTIGVWNDTCLHLVLLVDTAGSRRSRSRSVLFVVTVGMSLSLDITGRFVTTVINAIRGSRDELATSIRMGRGTMVLLND